MTIVQKNTKKANPIQTQSKPNPNPNQTQSKPNPNPNQTQFSPQFALLFRNFFSNPAKPETYNQMSSTTFYKLILRDSERHLSFSFLKPVKVGHATKKSNAVGNGVAFSSSILYNNFVGLEKIREKTILAEPPTCLCVLSGRKTAYCKR